MWFFFLDPGLPRDKSILTRILAPQRNSSVSPSTFGTRPMDGIRLRYRGRLCVLTIPHNQSFRARTRLPQPGDQPESPNTLTDCKSDRAPVGTRCMSLLFEEEKEVCAPLWFAMIAPIDVHIRCPTASKRDTGWTETICRTHHRGCQA